jgi:hypothetical protein
MQRSLAIAYVLGWSALVLVALVLAMRMRKPIAEGARGYVASLLVPWKLCAFGGAFAFFVFAAPYTGDPTWDWKDGGLMSLLTYLTAPWSIGTLARSRRTDLPAGSRRRLFFIAVIAWMFSASWSYDGYLFLRDGAYPRSWAANIPASSALYVAAGMLFSLVHVKDRGIVFDFMTPEWKRTPRSSFGKIALPAAILIVGVVLALSPFVLEVVRSLH